MFRSLWLGFVLVALIGFSPVIESASAANSPAQVAQASAPADSAIKAVVADLERFEKQAETMSPGASGAKRTLKLLGLSEGRLNSSPNKAHPSWIETNSRLQALKQRLTDIAAGKTPGAAPAAQPTATPAAKSAVDPAIAAATAELKRIDAGIEAMAPGDKVKGQQFINDLNKVAKVLSAYQNRADPHWIAAAKSYNALNKKTAAKANAPAESQPATTAQPPAAAAPDTTAQPATGETAPNASEQRVTAALKRLRDLEVSAQRITAGQPQAALGLVKQLDALSQGLVSGEDKNDPRWGELTGRYQTLRGAAVKIVVDNEANKLAKSLADNMRTLDREDPLTVQSAAETQRWRDFVAQARQRQAQIPDQDNSNVAALGGKIDAFEGLLEAKLAYQPAEQEPLWSGDWPLDRPVLIDSIGEAETRVLVQVHQTRPYSWVPEPELLVRFADYASDDVVVMQLLKDGQPHGKQMVCGARAWSEDAKWREFPKGATLAAFGCRPGKEFGLTESGLFTLKLTYKQTLLGVTHDLANLRLHVIELKQGSQNKPYIVYGDDFDMALSVATIEEAGGMAYDDGNPQENRLMSSIGSAALGLDQYADALIRVWFKTDGKFVPTKMTCFHNDKKVAEAATSGGSNRGYWTHSEAGRINVKWSRAVYRLHDLKFRPAADTKGSYSRPVHWMNENPGDYRCVITGGGEILKELFFAIGDDGKIVKPACQAQSMKTTRQVTLLRHVNKLPPKVAYDAEIGRQLGFYGNVSWQGDCPLLE